MEEQPCIQGEMLTISANTDVHEPASENASVTEHNPIISLIAAPLCNCLTVTPSKTSKVDTETECPKFAIGLGLPHNTACLSGTSLSEAQSTGISELHTLEAPALQTLGCDPEQFKEGGETASESPQLWQVIRASICAPDPPISSSVEQIDTFHLEPTISQSGNAELMIEVGDATSLPGREERREADEHDILQQNAYLPLDPVESYDGTIDQGLSNKVHEYWSGPLVLDSFTYQSTANPSTKNAHSPNKNACLEMFAEHHPLPSPILPSFTPNSEASTIVAYPCLLPESTIPSQTAESPTPLLALPNPRHGPPIAASGNGVPQPSATTSSGRSRSGPKRLRSEHQTIPSARSNAAAGTLDSAKHSSPSVRLISSEDIRTKVAFAIASLRLRATVTDRVPQPSRPGPTGFSVSLLDAHLSRAADCDQLPRHLLEATVSVQVRLLCDWTNQSESVFERFVMMLGAHLGQDQTHVNALVFGRGLAFHLLGIVGRTGYERQKFLKRILNSLTMLQTVTDVRIRDSLAVGMFEKLEQLVQEGLLEIRLDLVDNVFTIVRCVQILLPRSNDSNPGSREPRLLYRDAIWKLIATCQARVERVGDKHELIYLKLQSLYL